MLKWDSRLPDPGFEPGPIHTACRECHCSRLFAAKGTPLLFSKPLSEIFGLENNNSVKLTLAFERLPENCICKVTKLSD
jgi:rubredoxin